MTREEAITYLVPLRKDAERDDDSYRTEALNMAIKALQTDIVLCGECSYMMPDGRCFVFADDAIRPSVSDFCSYGERREE